MISEMCIKDKDQIKRKTSREKEKIEITLEEVEVDEEAGTKAKILDREVKMTMTKDLKPLQQTKESQRRRNMILAPRTKAKAGQEGETETEVDFLKEAKTVSKSEVPELSVVETEAAEEVKIDDLIYTSFVHSSNQR